MLIVVKPQATPAEIEAICARIAQQGYKAHRIPGESRLAIGITGNDGALRASDYTALPGVLEAIPVTKSYKLAGRDFKPTNTVFDVGPVRFGGGSFVVIAGPCAVESEDQTLRIARAVKARGAQVLRGGAYKPRTSPYSFQGLAEEGLKILAKARQETGMPVITEAMDLDSLEKVFEYADIIQIGARNMQNYSLLAAVGRLNKPVMLKRGLSATLEEWLMAAEYILSGGNDKVILCERGIRSFDKNTRNLLDLTAVAMMKDFSHLPVIVDPSHGTGRRDKVAPLSKAALAVGADGIMVEVHDRPQEALSDGPQALLPDEFGELCRKLKQLEAALQA